MRILQLFAFIFCIAFLSSCEILKDVANEQMDKRFACVPATGSNYNNSFQIISDKRFESDRIESANRETVRLKCMTTNQIRRVTELMNFESNRLDYAKFAYGYCSDPENYYINMQGLFKFDSSKEELEVLTR